MNFTDTERNEFLNELDNSPIDVTDWESKFIESNIDRMHFSDRQRVTVDKMIEKYGDRLGFF